MCFNDSIKHFSLVVFIRVLGNFWPGCIGSSSPLWPCTNTSLTFSSLASTSNAIPSSLHFTEIFVSCCKTWLFSEFFLQSSELTTLKHIEDSICTTCFSASSSACHLWMRFSSWTSITLSKLFRGPIFDVAGTRLINLYTAFSRTTSYRLVHTSVMILLLLFSLLLQLLLP